MLESIRSFESLDALLAGAGFVLVLAIWTAGVTLWQMGRARRQRQVDMRLGLIHPDGEAGRVLRLWHEGHEALTRVPGRQDRKSLLERLDQVRQEAGWSLPVSSLLLGTFGIMFLLFVFACAWTGYVVAGLVTAGAVPLVGWVHLKRCIAQRVALFDSQFVDALGLAARSLRAGHPLIGAFRLVAEELPAPVGTIFAEVCQQQSLGMNLQHALQRAAAESGSTEMKLFATSVSIQMRTGGNLADLIDRLAEVIRDRMRLARRVRVLTAQTQFSKRVLLVLPFVTFAGFSLIRPAYVAPLYTTPTGQLLLMGSAVSLLIGALLMNRMSVLKY